MSSDFMRDQIRASEQIEASNQAQDAAKERKEDEKRGGAKLAQGFRPVTPPHAFQSLPGRRACVRCAFREDHPIHQ